MNKKGLSLVEVMVAVAILGVVSLGMMSMMDNAMKAQKGIAAKDYNREFVARVRTHLADRNACTASFGPANPGGAIVVSGAATWSETRTTLRNAANTADVLPAGMADNASGDARLQTLEILRYTLNNYNAAQGTVELAVVTKRIVQKTGTIGASEMKIPITLRINVNGANQIINCLAVGTSSDGFWQVSPGNASDIFFGGNFVGIGEPNPEEKLEVLGNIMADMYLFPSDIRLKKNLHEAPGINKVQRLNVYSFNWIKDGRFDIGVMAQEIEKEFPHLVRTNSSGLKSVNYPGLIPILIQANKDMYEKQMDMQKRLENLENILNQQKAIEE